MGGVRFKSLSITAFRGIRDSVVFDLSAPLTLVFAPNGTGKTTMCEAAEWLLTGQIERLKDGRDFDARVLRSRFVDSGEPPSASAELLVEGSPRFLSRKVEGAQSPATFGADLASSAKYGPHDLLSRLAPAAAANEAHHLTAINLRQRWLKGTRFLSAEALAALIDTDEETIERRAQVFADLLGIRHLLDAEKQVEKYSVELLRRMRVLEQSTDQRATEARELEQALVGDTSKDNKALSAHSEISTAIILLEADEVSGNADITVDEQLTWLTAIHRRLQHTLESQTTAMRLVESQWPARASLEQAIADTTTLESELAQTLADIEEKGRAAAALLAEHSIAREVATEASRALTSSRDQLTKLATTLILGLNDAGMSTSGQETVATLIAGITESEWTRGAREQRRRALGFQRAALGQAGVEAERMRLLDADLARLHPQLLSEEALAVLRRDAGDAEIRARTAQSLLTATADPARRLQAAARDLLAHDHSGAASTCPACAHDWGDAARLRAAIAAVLDTGPEVVELARSDAAAATEAASAAHARLSAALAAKGQVEALELERTGLIANADRRQRDLQQLGIAFDQPLVSIAGALKRLDIAEALASLIEAHDRVQLPPSDDLGPLLPVETPLSSLLDQLGTSFNARYQLVQRQLSSLVALIEQASAARDRLRSEHAATQQRLRECRATLKEKGSELAMLRAYWDTAAPNTPWSDTALARIKEALVRTQQRLTKSGSHIEAARAAWSLETRRGRLAKLREAIQPLLMQQKRLQARIEAASRAQAVFRDTYTRTSRNQVSALSRVVNPLFARMHANRVYDHINLGEDANFLHWHR